MYTICDLVGRDEWGWSTLCVPMKFDATLQTITRTDCGTGGSFLTDGFAIGDNVGLEVGVDVGWTVGDNVGLGVGVDVGFTEGTVVGFIVGVVVGLTVGFAVGDEEG